MLFCWGCIYANMFRCYHRFFLYSTFCPFGSFSSSLEMNMYLFAAAKFLGSRVLHSWARLLTGLLSSTDSILNVILYVSTIKGQRPLIDTPLISSSSFSKICFWVLSRIIFLYCTKSSISCIIIVILTRFLYFILLQGLLHLSHVGL